MRVHLPALDGLRGVAILMVLAVHVAVPTSADWPSLLLKFVSSAGWLGVDLFFVLSGFLITGVLLDSRDSPSYFRNFYLRRALRIWPLFYLFLGFAFIVAPQLGVFDTVGLEGKPIIWGLFLENVDGVLNHSASTQFGVIWSLCIEEHVYLVLPALVLWLSRRSLGWVLVGAFVFAFVWRAIMVANGAWFVANYQLTPARLDTFAVGGLLAIQARRAGGLAELQAWPKVFLAASGLGLVWLAVQHFGFQYETLDMQTIGYSLSVVFFGSLLTISMTSAAVSRIMAARALRMFGRYSFAIYLIHYPLWHVLAPLFDGRSEPEYVVQIAAWATMLALCSIGGWLSWNLLERHALGLKRHFEIAGQNTANGAAISNRVLAAATTSP